MLKQLTPMIDRGLEVFTVNDLCRPELLVDSVIEKIHELPAGQLAHERLEHDLRLILNLLQDAVCGAYRALPLTTLADFLQVLHYFMKWKDRRPDTWAGGYLDDLEEVVVVMRQHREVIGRYQVWRAAQGESRAAFAA